MKFATESMNLESIMLNEVTQIQKGKTHTLSLSYQDSLKCTKGTEKGHEVTRIHKTQKRKILGGVYWLLCPLPVMKYHDQRELREERCLFDL